MVTRKIQGSPVKVTGAVPSDVEFESHLEEDFLVLMRFDHRVQHYERWQEPIRWFDEKGQRRIYTPDFFVQYKIPETGPAFRPQVVEIKPDFEDDDPRPVARLPRRDDPAEDEQKWAAAARHCKKRGFDFIVKRESAIRTPYLTNARFLLRDLERTLDDAVKEAKILDALKWGVRLPMGELIAKMDAKAERALSYRPILYRMIATRRLEVDLTERLSDAHMVGLPS